MSEEHDWTRHHSGHFTVCRKCGVSRCLSEANGWVCSGDILHAPIPPPPPPPDADPHAKVRIP